MDRELALESLSGGDPQSRRLAVRMLGKWNDAETLSAIVGALSDRSRDVQEAASDTLLEVGDGRTIRLLIPLLRSDSPSARNFARVVLERLGKADPRLIIELTHDADPRMRIFCANILGGMSDHDFAPVLHHLLDDVDVNVRDAAIVALGRLGASESVPRLAPFLKTGEPWVQFSAIDALSKIPGEEASRALLDALPEMDSDLSVAVIDAIGHQGSRASVDPLVALLERQPSLRLPIVRVLSGPLGDAVRSRGAGGWAPILARAVAAELGREPWNERGAEPLIGLLGAIGGAPEIPTLLKVLDRASPACRAVAQAALLALESSVDAATARGIREALSRRTDSGKDRP